MNMYNDKVKLITYIFSFCKLLKMKKYRRIMKKAIAQVMLSDKFQRFEVPPPDRTTTSTAWRTAWLHLMTATWGAVPVDEDDLADEGENHEARLGHSFLVSDLDYDLQEFLEFWNGDMTKNTLVHYCQGCCASLEASRAKGTEVTQKIYARIGGPDFQPARWGKLIPGIQFMSKFILAHNWGHHIFEMMRTTAPRENEVDEAAGENPEGVDVKQLIGIRVGRARRFFGQALNSFLICMVLSLLAMMEEFTMVLFDASNIPKGLSDNVKSKKAKAKAKVRAAARGEP